MPVLRGAVFEMRVAGQLGDALRFRPLCGGFDKRGANTGLPYCVVYRNAFDEQDANTLAAIREQAYAGFQCTNDLPCPILCHPVDQARSQIAKLPIARADLGSL